MREFPSFLRRDPAGFQKALHQRIEDYFQNVNVTPNANPQLKWKALVLFTLYFVPFGLLFISGLNWILFFSIWALMGLAMAGIGMNVMHDAIHGSWSQKSWVNKFFGGSIYLLCGHPLTWKVQHNFLHHQYTNLAGLDEDVEVRGLIRLHREDPLRPMHKHQHWYAPFFYSLLTLNWALTKDFTQMYRYGKTGLLKRFKTNERSAWLSLILGKTIYFGIFLVLPLVYAPYASWWIVLGWILMHVIAGQVLSLVFQLAHIVSSTDQPSWEGKQVEAVWMEHQMRTTCNFSRKSAFVTWYTGGLNYQIEHHLFPNISHAHYPKIAPLVKQSALEFGVPYNEKEHFLEALIDHFRTLKQLGHVA